MDVLGHGHGVGDSEIAIEGMDGGSGRLSTASSCCEVRRTMLKEFEGN